MKIKLINDPITSDYGRNLLRARGVKDVECFLYPDESALQDWRDLENIKEGVNLIFALPATARIGIIVDCDVDGFTSASIIGQYLTRYLPNLGINYYIHDGKAHGLEEHWEHIRDMNFDLLIVPDAGSNDNEYAKEIKCPILVIDHHLVEEPISAPNMVVINNQLSPKYKNKDLSGAGMAYQFCRAMDFYFDKNFAEDYIDLAALGICGDMMSGLEVENQYIWRKGFSNIKNYFFWSIAQKQSYSITGKMNASDAELIESLNPTSVAFYIVPLINAMVRVGTEYEKARMLTAFLDGHKMIPCLKRGAKGTFEEAAVESTRECVNARTHQNKFKDDAVARLEQKIFKRDLLENQILFIRLEEDDQFPSELNGLIAMQLSQRYKKPTIVARLNDKDFIRGSIRGLSNSELGSFKAFLDSTGLFEYVQGHDNAAGCSIKNSDLSKLHQIANERLSQYNFGEEYYEVNFERRASETDLDELIRDLAGYKFVWSQKNPEPLIYIKDIHFTKTEMQIMGKNNNTWKVTKNGISYIKFFANDIIQQCNQIEGNDIKVQLVGKASLNEWMGRTTPQIIVEQIEILPDQILDF
jgi:single-stranded-DNA-specific exonuclease